jgi:hypothetical protein
MLGKTKKMLGKTKRDAQQDKKKEMISRTRWGGDFSLMFDIT